MNRLISAYIIAGFLLLLIHACASTDVDTEAGNQPDWVMGKSKKYPDSRFLTGQGQGDSLEDAKRRALADLAKVFAVKVDEKSSDIQTVALEDGANQHAKQEAERRINTQTDEILKGAQILAKWHDRDTLTFHALAGLNRDQVSEMLGQKIRSLDQDSQARILQARDEKDLLKKAAAAEMALAAQIERIELQNRMQIIDVNGKGVPPTLNLSQLRADLDEILGRIRIQVEAAEAPVQALLEAGVSQAGFIADNNNPDYILKGYVERTPISQREGVFWLRGTLRIELRQLGDAGEVRGTEHWSIKVSATDEEILQQRFTNQLQAINNNKLKTTILGFALAQR